MDTHPQSRASGLPITRLFLRTPEQGVRRDRVVVRHLEETDSQRLRELGFNKSSEIRLVCSGGAFIAQLRGRKIRLQCKIAWIMLTARRVEFPWGDDSIIRQHLHPQQILVGPDGFRQKVLSFSIYKMRLPAFINLALAALERDSKLFTLHYRVDFVCVDFVCGAAPCGCM